MYSLQHRLTRRLLGLLLLVVAIGLGLLYVALREALLAQFDDGLRVKAMVIITATEQRQGKLQVRFSDRFLREFDDDLATDFFQVRLLGGNTVERSDSLGNRDLPHHFGSMEAPEYWDLDLPRQRGPGRAVGIRFLPRVDSSDRRAGAMPLEATVVVAAQREEIDAMLRRMGLLLAGGGAAILLATSLAVPLVLRPGLGPIRLLADRAQAIDATSLGERFQTEGLPVEMRPICGRLNDLLGRLESSFERERRFSADLAHELLTPLAELRMLAESALKWPETAGPDDHRSSLEIMQRMEKLVTHVLELARAEHGHLKVEHNPVDLAGLLREVAAPHANGAVDRGLTLELVGPVSLPARTDAGVFRVIVGNLVANAVAYAPADSWVRISWHSLAGAIEVTVANPAPEIDEEDLPRLFERFWRKDAARTGTQHSGLGLSLAAELAKVLGGSLAAGKTPGQDIVLTLCIPAAHSPGRS